MSSGQMSGGYAIGAQTKVRHRSVVGSNQIKKARKQEMKLTLKQRFRNWLMDTDSEVEADRGIYVEEDKLSSEGMRLQIYKASGGFVVETRSYDRNRDRNQNTMHVIRDDQDLGEALGKIVMMEALR